jgi:two-component system, LytTR family, response regulator
MMRKIACLIVEDEPESAERLSLLLERYHHNQINVIGTAVNGNEAMKLIQSEKPDLVFLDVQLREMNAFEILEKINPIDFGIIFTTGHQEFAISAIKNNALDYLLKPIDKDDLQIAIDKYFNLIKNETQKKLVIETNLDKAKIGIPTVNGIEFIYINEIIFCQADGNYSVLNLRTNKKYTVAKTLKEIEIKLAPYGFFRVHHSHLVNLSEIKFYRRGKGGVVVLNDNTEIEVAIRRKEELMAVLESM